MDNAIQLFYLNFLVAPIHGPEFIFFSRQLNREFRSTMRLAFSDDGEHKDKFIELVSLYGNQ